jgi:hypothetical protein
MAQGEARSRDEASGRLDVRLGEVRRGIEVMRGLEASSG